MEERWKHLKVKRRMKNAVISSQAGGIDRDSSDPA